MSIKNHFRMSLAASLFFLLATLSVAQAQYSGGSGAAEDPYQIATAADLIALGETPDDYDKHFILTADIDLDPNLPGGRVFDRAVIAPVSPFEGVFDGNDHQILNMTISGVVYLGLFGSVGPGGEITDVGLERASVTGGPGWGEVAPGVRHNIRRSTCVGGLVGSNEGSITRCYCTGKVTGESTVGGLAGINDGTIRTSHSAAAVSGTGDWPWDIGGLAGRNGGSIADSHSTGAVNGGSTVGGLVASNTGSITGSYSTGIVTGDHSVGGFVASNSGSIATSYSSGTVSGEKSVGGLVGGNSGTIASSYSTSMVSGSSSVGGLVASNNGWITTSYGTGAVTGNDKVGGLVGEGSGHVLHGVWDMETSGRATSAGGVGLTTAEMMDPHVLSLNGFGNDPNWVLDAGRDYPRLAWEGTAGQIIPAPSVDWLEGEGTAQNAYRIDTADQLVDLAGASFFWDKHFVLGSDVNLDPNLPGGQVFAQAVVPEFYGVFDGNNLTISHLTIVGQSDLGLGLFGQLDSRAQVKNLGVVDVNIVGSGGSIGGLAGGNRGQVVSCYSTGTIAGDDTVGGLVGVNRGRIVGSHCSGTVTAQKTAGILVGENYFGNITACASNGKAKAASFAGGLVGMNCGGEITGSSSDATVWGDWSIGGLVGQGGGNITASHSTGMVSGTSDIGGLVGIISGGIVTQCWSSATITGDESSIGGLAGTNFGTITMSLSAGNVNGNSQVGGLVGAHRERYGMGGTSIGVITACYSTGVVNGNQDVGGLVGILEQDNSMRGLSLGFSVRAAATDETASNYYGSGAVSVNGNVGGLVRYGDEGNIARSHRTGEVAGNVNIGGLFEYDYSNGPYIGRCYSTSTVNGDARAGGLVGNNDGGSVASSYWDVETSGLLNMCGSQSDGGTGCDNAFGLTTAELQTASTFLEAGWDFVGETENGPNDVWKIVEGQTYPLLSWQKYGGGTGEPNDPYLIYTAEHLNALGAEPNDYDKHFKLMADVDLDPNLPGGHVFEQSVILSFSGTFDGNGHAISNLTITGGGGLGLFGWLHNGAIVSNLGLEAVDVNATGDCVGGLVGCNSGRITSCYSTGGVFSGGTDGCIGGMRVGGLVGDHDGTISDCYSSAAVTGETEVGGLVGYHYDGVITSSFSTGTVTGLCPTPLHVFAGVGGLVGRNYWGTILNCYSTGSVSGGDLFVAGLVGRNDGTILNCYSNGLVRDYDDYTGGLVGISLSSGLAMNSFWDMETSGQTTSPGGGTGLTTPEMHAASTFLEAGWDFIDETDNGTDDVWWILEGQDNPRLWWEMNEN